MISMRRIWAQRPNLVSNSRPDPIIGASRMGMLLVRLANRAKPFMRSARPILAPDQLAILRERSIVQLAAINSTDDAAA
jgi:hypothetical protein